MNWLSFSKVLNSKGKELRITQSSYFGEIGAGTYTIGIYYDPGKLPKGPVIFIINDYPGEITGEVKVKIK